MGRKSVGIRSASQLDAVMFEDVCSPFCVSLMATAEIKACDC